MSGLSKGIRKLHDWRYAMLAATMLSAVALPRWGVADTLLNGASEGRIVVAQNVDPKDKDKNKGKKSGTGQTGQTGQQGSGQTGQQGTGTGTGQGQKKTFSKQNPNNQQGTGTGTGQQGSGQTGQQGSGQTGQQGTGTGTGQGQKKTFSKQNPTFQQGSGQTGQQGSGQTGQQGSGQTGQQGTGTGTGTGQGQKKTFSKQNPTFQQGTGQTGQQGTGTGTGQQGTGTGTGTGQGLPKTFSKTGTGKGGQTGGATGQQFSTIEQLRSTRKTTTDASGKTVIQEGNRFIVHDGNRTMIRSDDSERLLRTGRGRREQRGNETYTILSRGGGVEIINITDRNGNLLQRIRRVPGQRDVFLIDNRRRGIGPGGVAGIAAGVFAAGVVLGLAAPNITIPRDRYIVDMDQAPPELLYDTFDAPPLMEIERPYSLDEVRYNVELRDRMRRVDINTINFESGSWEISPDQYDRLAGIAEAMQRVLQRRPEEIFMVEGYTDAVGQDDDNMTLSDRRAQSVAEILSEQFQIPPENLVTQGYGSQYLKVQTPEALRANRRVAVRRIGPLLAGRAQ